MTAASLEDEQLHGNVYDMVVHVFNYESTLQYVENLLQMVITNLLNCEELTAISVDRTSDFSHKAVFKEALAGHADLVTSYHDAGCKFECVNLNFRKGQTFKRADDKVRKGPFSKSFFDLLTRSKVKVAN